MRAAKVANFVTTREQGKPQWLYKPMTEGGYLVFQKNSRGDVLINDCSAEMRLLRVIRIEMPD